MRAFSLHYIHYHPYSQQIEKTYQKYQLFLEETNIIQDILVNNLASPILVDCKPNMDPRAQNVVQICQRQLTQN